MTSLAKESRRATGNIFLDNYVLDSFDVPKTVLRGLSCLLAFELKIGEFKPEYVGNINLYFEALDREVKKECVELVGIVFGEE